LEIGGGRGILCEGFMASAFVRSDRFLLCLSDMQ
ncbi:hypothetical protein T12_5144, partial [Trichinella patagoniensis]